MFTVCSLRSFCDTVPTTLVMWGLITDARMIVNYESGRICVKVLSEHSNGKERLRDSKKTGCQPGSIWNTSNKLVTRDIHWANLLEFHNIWQYES